MKRCKRWNTSYAHDSDNLGNFKQWSRTLQCSINWELTSWQKNRATATYYDQF